MKAELQEDDVNALTAELLELKQEEGEEYFFELLQSGVGATS